MKKTWEKKNVHVKLMRIKWFFYVFVGKSKAN